MGGGTPQNNVVSSGYPRFSAAPKAKQIHSIYRDRLRQFTDEGQYYENGLLSYVWERYQQSDALASSFC